MIEFKVVNTPRHDRFEQQVTELLNEGWSLHGTPFVKKSASKVSE
jgi:hypothetical protein